MHTIHHLYKINKCEKIYVIYIDACILLRKRKKCLQTVGTKQRIVFLDGP